MDAQLWADIKRLYSVEKVRVSDIARRLRVDRKTVRRAIASERLPVTARVPRQKRLLSPYTGYLTERLKTYPHLPAPVLLEELKKQGYVGSLRILQEHLQQVRHKTKEVFLRIETSPGEEAQCDWANCGSVAIDGVTRRLSAFVMVLSYSRLIYVEFTLSQCLEDFIQCHVNAFQFFQGVPKRILYDNLKAVVLSRIGSDIRFNPGFMEFSGVYGFEPKPCNVARGNEKGKVENGIYYLRISFLAGKVLTWPDCNRDVHLWLNTVANIRNHRTTGEQPVDRWEREKPCLIPLPSHGYDATITQAARSSHQALVRFQSNFYSVPHAYAYKTLILKADATQVRILSDAFEIAVHTRRFGRGLVIDNPKHYEGVLSTKRRHFTLILNKRFIELGEPARHFREGLVRTEARPWMHLQKILGLIGTYGKEEVLSAMQHADTCNVYAAGYIKSILLQRRAAKGLPEIQPIDIAQRPAWNDIQTDDPDLSVYD